MTDMFTQFDRLGSALAKLSFDHIDLALHRGDDGEVFYSFSLKSEAGGFATGTGNTPTEALTKALEENARRERMLVEVASEQVAA